MREKLKGGWLQKRILGGVKDRPRHIEGLFAPPKIQIFIELKIMCCASWVEFGLSYSLALSIASDYFCGPERE